MDKTMNTLMDEFIQKIKESKYDGELLEFGTGSGFSTDWFARKIQKKIFTFDGFCGLPKTNKIIPTGTIWQEGQLRFDENSTRELLKKYTNVFVNKCMTSELKEPSYYGITKIAGANLDLDLYEGTLDALFFIDKCEWKNILLRFDDWGFYRNTSQVEEEVFQHEKSAFEDFIKQTKYKFIFFDEYKNLCDNRQCIIEVFR